MLGDTNLSNRHEVEQLRRSVAMLYPKAKAFNREDSIVILDALLDKLAKRQPGP